MRLERGSVAGAIGMLILISAAEAYAYCRTRTCDPRDPQAGCVIDPETNCVLTGDFLQWPTQCVSFSVHRDGSVVRDISYDQTHEIVSGAFAKWISVSCENGFPAIEIADRGAVSCGHSEYNQDAGNANAWLFRDDFWPHEGPNATLALTIITFNTKNGEIYDVDVEINSAESEITVGDDDIQSDLESIVTHEAGHFLGLSHSNVPGATMVPDYLSGQTHLRSLEPDDAAGICAAYPPGRQADDETCTPRHGYSTRCGSSQESTCSTLPGRRAAGAGLMCALGCIAAGVGLRRIRGVQRRA